MTTNFILKPIKATKELPIGKSKINKNLSVDVMCMVKGNKKQICIGNYSYISGGWIVIGISEKCLFKNSEIVWFKKLKTKI